MRQKQLAVAALDQGLKPGARGAPERSEVGRKLFLDGHHRREDAAAAKDEVELCGNLDTGSGQFRQDAFDVGTNPILGIPVIVFLGVFQCMDDEHMCARLRTSVTGSFQSSGFAHAGCAAKLRFCVLYT